MYRIAIPIAAAALLAAGCGSSTATKTRTVSSPPVTVIVTHTKTKTVKKAPAACENALEDMRLESVAAGKALRLVAAGNETAATPYINAMSRDITRATPLYYECNGLAAP